MIVSTIIHLTRTIDVGFYHAINFAVIIDRWLV